MILLYFLGHTMNVMTLGGLALAVGILVDDATVEIENIHRNIAMGRSCARRSWTARSRSRCRRSYRRWRSASSSCGGLPDRPRNNTFSRRWPSRSSSRCWPRNLLSRTVIPTLVKFLLQARVDAHGRGPLRGFFPRISKGSSAASKACAPAMGPASNGLSATADPSSASSASRWLSAGLLLPWVGRDFFPTVDTGQLRLHVKAPAGTRLEDTEQIFTKGGKRRSARSSPNEDRTLILDNFGLPDASTWRSRQLHTRSSDGEILISLARSAGIDGVVREAAREKLPEEFPNLAFYFQPADIVSQILNFASRPRSTSRSAASTGTRLQDRPADREERLRRSGRGRRPSPQVIGRAASCGSESTACAPPRRASRSGTLRTTCLCRSPPAAWSPPTTGPTPERINYPLAVQTPQHQIDSMESIGTMTMGSRPTRPRSCSRSLLDRAGNHAPGRQSLERPAHLQRAGGRSGHRSRVRLEGSRPHPAGCPGQASSRVSITVRGSGQHEHGVLALAWARRGALLVYFLMVVNFQSWVDPFIIITALRAPWSASCGPSS